jgi:hypothetical protein
MQGCRRAEPVLLASCPTLTFFPTVQTMDDDDAVYNPFSSSHIWNQNIASENAVTFESSLFAPLELDSMFGRVLCADASHISDRVQ